MKVLSFSTFYFKPLGGAEISIRTLAKGLDKHINHTLITPTKFVSDIFAPIRTFSSIMRIPDPFLLVGHSFIDYLLYKRIRALIRDEKYDLIHVHDMFLLPAVSRIAKELRIPYIITVRDPLPKVIWSNRFRFPLKHLRALLLTIRNPIYKKALEDATKIITVSDYLKKHLLQFISKDDSDILTIYNSAEITNEIDKVHKSNSNIVTYSVQTRLIAEKGVEYFIKAFALLINDGYKVKARILGSGYQKEFLEKLAKRLGISNEVEFSGQINKRADFFKLLNNSDVLVSPAIYPEPFTRTILDAYSLHKALVLTDVGGNKDLAQKGVAMYAEPASEESLYMAMKKVYPLKTRIGLIKQLTKFGTVFDEAYVIKRHLDLYRSILEKN
ncbi:MAG: hypothetical protein Fur003_3190 [Candidatus Dojkabacteria bacterium]